MTDVYLHQSDDGGDLNISGGVVEMRDGLETAVYLSLFGGNEDDPGGLDSPASWWGNLLEADPDRRLRSETQNLLISLPATTGNLKRLRAAIERDLAWLVSGAVASDVVVVLRLASPHRVSIDVAITIADEVFRFAFTKAWQGRSA